MYFSCKEIHFLYKNIVLQKKEPFYYKECARQISILYKCKKNSRGTYVPVHERPPEPSMESKTKKNKLCYVKAIGPSVQAQL